MLAAGGSAATPAPPLDRITILAPASGGGGWDQTARAMARVLQGRGFVREVEVVNSPGAGGAIGLAQFVGEQRGNPNALLVGGLVMVSAIRSNRATVSLLQATPIARLTGEYEVVAVPAGSSLQSLEDLADALRADPGAISWAGGSGGGADQILVASLASALGIDPVRMNYVPFSGGGEVAEALARGRFAVGVSGYGEIEPEIRARRVRALAISSEERLPGLNVPTLREQGLPVSLVNWRGVFAAPGITAEERARLVDLMAAMARDPAWRAVLREYHWTDLFLPADAFVAFVREEQARAEAGPDPRVMGAGAPERFWRGGLLALRSHPFLAAAVIAASLTLAVLLVWQRARARRRERALSHDLDVAREAAQRISAEAEARLRGLGEQIDRQFEQWGLTSAEREVALLMLKGLRHKEIANLRGTSERTVRQQALTIYKKAGLDGRTDLAAYFLEDLLLPTPPETHPRTGAA